MAPSYKLYYFNARGRAEAIRMLFAAAEIKFEDIRLQGEQWAKEKPNTPFGQMPFLEVDGMRISQSKAILRLVGKRAGMAGSTEIEAAIIDMIGDCIEDVMQKVFQVFYAPEAEKPAKMKVFVEETLPQSMPFFERFLTDNPKKSGFLVGAKMTWVDILMAGALETIKNGASGFAWDKYPACNALVTKVNTTPKIAEWIKNRPQTEH